MQKRMILVVLLLAMMIGLGRTLAGPPETVFSIDTSGNEVLVVCTDRSADIVLFNLNNARTASYKTARLVLSIEDGGRYQVVVRGARRVFHALYPKQNLQMFNKKALNAAGERGIIDELNSGGPLPQVGYERPCEEGEQSHE